MKPVFTAAPFPLAARAGAMGLQGASGAGDGVVPPWPNWVNDR